MHKIQKNAGGQPTRAELAIVRLGAESATTKKIPGQLRSALSIAGGRINGEIGDFQRCVVS